MKKNLVMVIAMVLMLPISTAFAAEEQIEGSLVIGLDPTVVSPTAKIITFYTT